MSFSRTDDFPESSLNDDMDRPNIRGLSTSRGRGSRRISKGQQPPRSTLPMVHEATPSPFQTGAPPSHLKPLLAHGTTASTFGGVSSASTPLTKLSSPAGARPIPAWAAFTPQLSGSLLKGTLSSPTTALAPQQTTPFVAGVNILHNDSTPTKATDTSPTEDNVEPDGAVTDTRIIPRPEPDGAHLQQLRPSLTAYNLAQSIYNNSTTTWMLEAFTTPTSSEGTSVLVSMFVDYVSTQIRPDMSLSQQYSLAQLAITTAPSRLFSALRSPAEARSFTERALSPSTKLPPLFEPQLCPGLTPGLIPNVNLRARVNDPNLLRGGRLHILQQFINCYYPATAAALQDTMKSLEMDTINEYLYTPEHSVGKLACGKGSWYLHLRDGIGSPYPPTLNCPTHQCSQHRRLLNPLWIFQRSWAYPSRRFWNFPQMDSGHCYFWLSQ